MTNYPEHELCDACQERPWVVKFEWSYTGPEKYCERHILEPIEGQPGTVLLDYMPDCQNITHRIVSPAGQVISREVKYHSTFEVYPILTSRIPRIHRIDLG